MKTKCKNTLILSPLCQLSHKQKICRFRIRVATHITVLLPVPKGEVVEPNGAVRVRQARNDDDARGEGIGAGFKYEGPDGFDEYEMGEVIPSEMRLVAVLCDSVSLG